MVRKLFDICSPCSQLNMKMLFVQKMDYWHKITNKASMVLYTWAFLVKDLLKNKSISINITEKVLTLTGNYSKFSGIIVARFG